MAQFQKTIDYFLWIGNNAIHIWSQKERSAQQVVFHPKESIPYVPKFHAVWEGTDCPDQLRRMIGGKFRARMSRILMAVPDDISCIEEKALEEFAMFARSSMSEKKFLMVPQALILEPALEKYIAITWSCRCFSVSLVQNKAVIKKNWTDISSNQENLLSEVKKICPYENLPVIYPQIDTSPFPLAFGKGIPLEDIANHASVFIK